MNNFWKKRLHSFQYAFSGISTLFRETPNARIHSAMTIAAVLLGFLLSISRTEWLAIIVVIGLVLALEAVNSSIETLADLVSKERNQSIKKLKDLAAAGVLLAAVVALTVGLLVFLPKIGKLLF